MRITYIGGPTAIVEHAGARLLTDPTFEAAGERYELPARTSAYRRRRVSRTWAPSVRRSTVLL